VIGALSIGPFQKLIEETGEAAQLAVNIAAVGGAVLGLLWFLKIARDIWQPAGKGAG
jgi:hypothetical protein